MNTYHDMKQKFIDYMMTVDYDKMNTMDLANVALILKTLYETEKEDYMNKLLSSMASAVPSFSSFGCATTAREVKENG